MQVTFDPDFDAGCWPGPLEGRDAAAGEAWVGPMGLVEILETQLGLGGIRPTQVERVGALAGAIRKTDGFWAESARKDLLAVSRTLLRWRDRLWLGGWRDGPVKAARIDGLGKVCKDVPPGMPDRLVSVLDALKGHEPDIEEIILLETREGLPALWQRILAGLESYRTRIHLITPETPAPDNDLGHARTTGFQPSGDGSLQLLRPFGPLEAAEQVAAWLSVQEDSSDTVVVGSDKTLDGALRRFGLPTTGGMATRETTDRTQLLPLALEMGWSIPDPALALDLVVLPNGPVPNAVAWLLSRALQEWPAVGSDKWHLALDEGLDSIKDEDQRERVKQRLEALFRRSVPRGSDYPAAEARTRAGLLRDWAKTRLAFSDSDADTARWTSIMSHCASFTSLLDSVGLNVLTEAQLLAFTREASTDLGSVSPHLAQVGIMTVGAPGCVAGAASRVIWWDFTRESAPTPDILPLSSGENKALTKAGVQLPEPSAEAVRLARRWRRPFENSVRSLMLVCPERGEDGEDRHPHPLWDEISARLCEGASSVAIECRTPRASLSATVIPEAMPLPVPQRVWDVVSATITLPGRLSPSSSASLVGCPFQFVVQRVGGVWAGQVPSLPDENQLLGSLAHQIIGEVLESKPACPDDAASLASKKFQNEGPRLAGNLFLPGAAALLAMARAATVESARQLVSHLENAGLSVKAIETPVSGKAFGLDFEGRPDLVAGSPTVVIDLKWGGETYHLEDLLKGTATQLAAYAHLLRSGGKWPAVAFFILRSQRMMALQPTKLKDAEPIEGPSAETTWKAFEQSVAVQRDQIGEGRIVAPGVPDEDGEGVPRNSHVDEGGRIVVQPPCRFCDLGFLCGVAQGGEA